MEQLKICDSDYDHISHIIYEGRNHTSDLSKLSRWKQPLKFRSKTYVLAQNKGGPCGFFAVLQSCLCYEQAQEDKSDINDILIEVVLSIFQRISPYYVFCEKYDPKNKTFIFQQTNDKNMALLYIVQNNYFNKSDSCLLLLISYVFASFRYGDTNSCNEPFIYEDQMTSMKLNWFLLTGSCSNRSISELEMNHFKCYTQRNIGIKVLKSKITETIGTWLNPDASIFVCFNINHFYTVIVDKNNRYVIVDNLNSLFPIRVENKKPLNWI